MILVFSSGCLADGDVVRHTGFAGLVFDLNGDAKVLVEEFLDVAHLHRTVLT